MKLFIYMCTESLKTNYYSYGDLSSLTNLYIYI